MNLTEKIQQMVKDRKMEDFLETYDKGRTNPDNETFIKEELEEIKAKYKS